jgi:hypothetical protein
MNFLIQPKYLIFKDDNGGRYGQGRNAGLLQL